MKLLVLLVSLLFSLGAAAIADLEQPLSLAIKNYSGSDFLKEVSKQSKIKFVMNKNIKFPQKFSIYVKDEALKKILDNFAKAQNVNWVALGDNTIRFSPKH